MRGGFVACFGQVEPGELERVAGAFRWHRGSPERYAMSGFQLAVLSDPEQGPHVEIQLGNARVVHGEIDGPADRLRASGSRFAVVEVAGGRLVASRDPLGLAPLFFRSLGETLWLATEVAPLIALRRPAPDLTALARQSALVPDDSATGFVGIERVLPGHSLIADGGQSPIQRRYWAPESLFGRFKGSRAEAVEELWARLLDSADRALVGNDRAPTGVLLSGGLDSAAVAAAAARLEKPLSAVHVGFPDFVDAAEEPYARAVAEAVGTPLTVVPGQVGPWQPEDDLELSPIPYLTPPAYTADLALGELSAQGVAVALDGNDGDGVLGYSGREWGQLVVTRQLSRLVGLAGSYGIGAVGRGVARDVLPPRVTHTLRRRGDDPMTYLQGTERYFRPELYPAMRAADHERWRSPFGEWRARQLRQVLPVTTTRMEEHELRGARYGIDLRHPFADRQLVELLLSLPAQIKGDPLRSKDLLRGALAGHLPTDVLERDGKPGYLDVLAARVDPARCLEWIDESGVKLPLVSYDTLRRDGAGSVPLFLLLLLTRAHVFAAGA